MPTTLDLYEVAAEEIIRQVGNHIVIGVPLGLGKPIGILNALYYIATLDQSIRLTIITGLTFSRPTFKNTLEKKFAQPILERMLGNYEEPHYEKARALQQLPPNIDVIEFFFMPGKFLHNAYAQQHYISSCYQYAARDAVHLDMNVLAQLVAPSPTDPNKFSLSCNTDLFHETKKLLDVRKAQGKKIAIVAEVNAHLPYMHGPVAEVDADTFTLITDRKKYCSLFAVPRDEITTQDHLIGLYTSILIKDNGCLQIGIGKLSNALANALIFRHQKNDLYRDMLEKLNISGETDTFQTGLYASTEMLSDEYMQLYKAGILKKKVFDHIGLQRLLNDGKISEIISPEMIDVLIENKIIHAQLTVDDVAFLQTFGIIHEYITYEKNCLKLPDGETVSTDLSAPAAKQRFLASCLGKQLTSGKILHAGFYFGSVDFYQWLRTLSQQELTQIEMTAIARTNTLLWSSKLLTLQRQHARFVNTTLMATLIGGVISDGLTNYQEVSGVGGQYDFVSMAAMLPSARSIINCRSTRATKHGVESTIVWDYPNSTIPRYLRDTIVTEYGIADCRSKTDMDVIKTVLNIADSRFQPALLQQAKRAGKLPADYQIPKQFRHNFPDKIERFASAFKNQGYFHAYPFGSDLTQDELVLSCALVYLKKQSGIKLFWLVLVSLFYSRSDARIANYLQRMELLRVNSFKEYVYKKLLTIALSINDGFSQ